MEFAWRSQTTAAILEVVNKASPVFKTLLFAVLVSFVFVTVTHTNPEHVEGMLRTHENVLSIESRGQLTIHLFGPLSKLLATPAAGALAIYSSAQIVWAVVGGVFASSIRGRAGTNEVAKAICCSAIIFLYMARGTPDGALDKVRLQEDSFASALSSLDHRATGWETLAYFLQFYWHLTNFHSYRPCVSSELGKL